jgi:hypothetical protein
VLAGAVAIARTPELLVLLHVLSGIALRSQLASSSISMKLSPICYGHAYLRWRRSWTPSPARRRRSRRSICVRSTMSSSLFQ